MSPKLLPFPRRLKMFTMSCLHLPRTFGYANQQKQFQGVSCQSLSLSNMLERSVSERRLVPYRRQCRLRSWTPVVGSLMSFSWSPSQLLDPWGLGRWTQSCCFPWLFQLIFQERSPTLRPCALCKGLTFRYSAYYRLMSVIFLWQC